MASNPLPILAAAGVAFYLMKAKDKGSGGGSGDKQQGEIPATGIAGTELMYRWVHQPGSGGREWTMQQFQDGLPTDERHGVAPDAAAAMLAIQAGMNDMQNCLIVEFEVNPSQSDANMQSLIQRLQAGEETAALAGAGGNTFQLNAESMSQLRRMGDGEVFRLTDSAAGELTITKRCTGV